MTTYSQHHPAQASSGIWPVITMIAALVGFGVGSYVEIPDLRFNSLGTSQEHGLPDWHGNVKRSQGY
ncbi:hypothetical protein [Cognatishimia activa]|uniref:hypothetical protein n=1 Tax=Cognatishimia activa TaxID=1715691 RepID=UPI0022323A54|nr:hypothetical protein [Cognatishimia activa]UZD92492.1 hypothetical protein M0D42_07750 [Cognatishimia activa]